MLMQTLQACLGGALAIVGRDILAARAGIRESAVQLARGTSYKVLVDGALPPDLLAVRKCDVE